ncbi:NRPS-like enzyme [Pseudozyma hubeiensis SY62]|uniref:NRPS-like enzyme n=1 Tax=Pseudozyma hubeiensis (strain SY62) TaxID=1305764 RepID=R9PAL7_PSEHS|nr:NRPS-like enzyme [Pseudozyma hubeiensis SY62]GAC98282.1 NRPS-like enzyme [Pseudozyma hubeiensis SY62]
MLSGQRFAWPSLNALFADRVKNMPNKTFLAFPKAGATNNPSAFAYDEYTFGQVDDMVSHLAASYAVALPPRRVNQPSIAVGLFASSGFDYIVHSLALFRLGHVVVYLSTNNSTAALAHLVKVTSITTLLYSFDKAEAISALKPMLEEQGLASVDLVRWTSVSEALKLSLATTMDSRRYTTELSYDQESLEDAFVIHSSGSTGFPKPNFLK